MGFRDILKHSFLDNMTTADITLSRIVLTLVMAGLIGLYIFGVYRVVTRKAFYSKSFNISLVAMALITASIIITIQASVVISLGMVGALSIVRFRTAIKDPMDLVFLFWSISVGIICGAGLFETGIILSVVLSVLLFVLELIPVSKAPMVLVLNLNSADAEDQVFSLIEKHVKHYKVKSRNLTKQAMDMVVELRVKDAGGLVKDLGQIDSVTSAALLSHDGEVTY